MDLTGTIPNPRQDGIHSDYLDKDYEGLLIRRISNSAPTTVDAQNAGQLLHTIWNEASNLDCFRRPPQLATLELCNSHIERHPTFVPLLTEVHANWAYAWLCKKLTNTTPLPMPGGVPVPKMMQSIKASIQSYIELLKPKILMFLSEPSLPTWEPPACVNTETRDFYAAKAIPSVRNRPSLLLHNLHQPLNRNIFRFFKTGTHCILSDTSGAGKTRGLFEGLSSVWGFYFTLAQGADGIGSRDMQAMVQSMEITPGWKRDIFEDPRPAAIKQASLLNEAIASNRLAKVLLARWLVFDCFIQTARQLNGGELPDKVKHDWLIMQILPVVLVDDKDPFSGLIDSCLVGVSTRQLEELNNKVGVTSVLQSAFDPRTESFFYVLDEAQVAGQQYLGSFADAEGKLKYPVLRPIFRHFTGSSNVLTKTILSGTGFSLDLFKVALISGIAKDSAGINVEHTRGEFMDPDVQQNYLAEYLPPRFLASPSGESYLAQAYKWVRGRCRFSARLAEETMMGPWLESAPAAPHKTLDHYVEQLAGFKPVDGDPVFLDMEPDIEVARIDNFEWEKLEIDQGTLTELSYSMYTYITRGKFPMWHQERQVLVEYGLARFVGQGVQIQEPIVLVSIMQFFARKGRTLVGNIQAPVQDNKGTAFEEVVLLALTKLLQDRKLTDIFQFLGTPPEWADKKAQIIAQSSPGQFRRFDITGDQPNTLPAGVAFFARDVDAIKHWMTEGGTGWCIPHEAMGPELMTWIRLSSGEKMLLLVRAKCRAPDSINTTRASVIVDAVRSLTPSLFFTSETRKRSPTEMKEALETINTRAEALTDGKHNLIRVIAAFPLAVDIKSSASSIVQAVRLDQHPLVCVSESLLTSALATTPHGTSIVSMLKNSIKRSL